MCVCVCVCVSRHSYFNKKIDIFLKEQSDLGLHYLHVPFCQTLWCTKFKDIYHSSCNFCYILKGELYMS